MVVQITGYRVFIASPGGLNEERKSFKEKLFEYSEDESIERHVSFIPVGWEETLGGIGRPQEIINDEIKKCDFFVLLLWDRWGSPPSKDRSSNYSSGTEEEFYIALECLRDKNQPMRKIVVLFKGVDERQLSDPGPQLKKVIEFKRKIEANKILLYEAFDTIEEFTRIIRRHLSRWVRDDESKRIELSDQIISITKTHYKSASIDSSKFVFMSTEEILNTAEELAHKGSFADAEALFAYAVIDRNTSDALNRYGRFLRRVTRHAHSQVIFERVISITNENNDREARTFALSNLGVILRRKGQNDEALKIFEESNRLAHKLRSAGRKHLAYNYSNIGQILSSQKDFKGAEIMLRKSIKIQEELDDIEGQSKTYCGIGVIRRRCGDLEGAAENLKNSITFAKKLGERGQMQLPLIYGNLGLVYFHQKKLDEAKKYCDLSLSLNKKFRQQHGIAFILALFARISLLERNLEDAIKLNEESFQINSQIGQFDGLANNYFLRGEIAFYKDKIDKARDNFEQSLELNEKNKNSEGITENLNAIGDIFLKSDDLRRACKSWEKAYKISITSSLKHISKVIQKKIEANCKKLLDSNLGIK